jgi:hypothetical protein
MVVRFSSGATICIENTITVRFFRSLPQLTKQAFRIFIARNAPTHDADGACREMPLETAGYELKRMGRLRVSTRVVLRDIGGDSEIPESSELCRRQATVAEIFYVADLPSISS